MHGGGYRPGLYGATALVPVRQPSLAAPLYLCSSSLKGYTWGRREVRRTPHCGGYHWAQAPSLGNAWTYPIKLSDWDTALACENDAPSFLAQQSQIGSRPDTVIRANGRDWILSIRNMRLSAADQSRYRYFSVIGARMSFSARRAERARLVARRFARAAW